MLSEFGPAPELSILNRHPKSLNGPPRLHELVPISSPTNAPAVDFLEDGSKRRTLAYHELHALSDTLARKITQALAGVKDASDIVPILLPQSPELYIAILAILKAGRAFCPMGLDVPQERLAFILKDVSANLVITDSTQTERLSYLPGIHALLVNEEISDPKDHADAKVSLLNPTQLAYVLYTSGSTGRPKAVSVSHRAVTQSLLAHDRHIPQFSRFLQFAAPTFDVSIFEIFFPLYRGCTVVGCTRTHMLSDLPRTITSLQVDAAELTPTVVSNLLRGRSSVPGLKLLLTIGEMLTRDVVEEYGGQSRKDSILWGMYGPTEAAIHCTLQPQFTSDFPVGNIGFPLDTVSAFIAAPLSESSVDSSIEVLPTGETGELVVGGPQIAEKYLNRADLTAVAFVKDMEFGYLYRTGDKARLNRDGTLECLGRIVSGQVKLRGQRVELGEVEQVILNINACYSAVVMVIDATLVAFCAVNSANTTKEFILARCGDLLPNYMVPTEVLLVQSMPQLASGKIDKKSLEAQYLRGHYESGVSAASSIGHPESHLAASIRKKLGGRDVRQDTPLDSISIDSLRSILIASTLREQGYFVTPIEILSTPRLTQLIENCEMKGKSKAAPAKLIHNTQMSVEQIPELREVQDDIQDILFCTSLQEAMLVETSTKPSAYCNWIELELEQPLTYPQVRAYLDSLAQKNEILRAGFLTTSSTSRSFIQVIWKDLMPSAVREVARFSRTYTLGSTEALLRPFNVQFIAGSHTSRLLFQIHHALYDGWSFDLLIHDLNQLVSNCTPKPRPQYREVLQYYLGLEDENISETKAYWTNLLQDFCPTPLPNLNGKIVSSKGLRSIRGEASIDAQFLYSRARDLSINPQVFFQTASAYIFGLYAGSSDIVIGTVTSGRTIPVTRIEDIIGPCIASLPFRLEISENMTIDELLHKTQKANRNMLQHCTLPLREITKVCGLQPGVRLFDILFVWQQSPISNDEEGLKLRVVDSADDLEFKVTLEFEPRDDRILYRITYDPSNIPEQQIIHFSNQIDQVVNHLLHYTHSQVGDVMKCFSSDTVSVANPEPEETQGSTQRGLSCAVEKWALKTPEMNAVVYGSLSNGVMQVQETLTYASLNARANQLAHTLLEHGVGDDQLVCIILEKSTDLYVSILAVLKIGCGYLPITPDTPIERTKRILTDAEVALCISHSSISVDLPQDTITLLDLDKIDLSHCSDRNLNVQYNGSRLAYAVFTSGSTGKPKGVLVTQNNLMSNLDYLSSIYPTTAHSRLLQSCSQAFDVSVFEIFFSWHVGICLCTATKDDLFYNFEAAIDKLKITHLSLTPTVAGMVDPIRVPNVKFLVTAGEALTENVRRKWAGKGLFQGIVFEA
jgi:amino acid adenylation domain-containing protein